MYGLVTLLYLTYSEIYDLQFWTIQLSLQRTSVLQAHFGELPGTSSAVHKTLNFSTHTDNIAC